jgi:hypothetical protein
MIEGIKTIRNQTKENVQELAKDGKTRSDVPKLLAESGKLGLGVAG